MSTANTIPDEIALSAQDILWRAQDAQFIWREVANLAGQVNELDDQLDAGDTKHVRLRHHLSQLHSHLCEACVWKIVACWGKQRSRQFTKMVAGPKPTFIVAGVEDETMRERIKRVRRIRNDLLAHPLMATREIQRLAFRPTGSDGPARAHRFLSAFTRDYWSPSSDQIDDISAVIVYTIEEAERIKRQGV